MGVEQLAEYGASGVAIASLVAIYWIICKFLTYLRDIDHRHNKAYEYLAETIKINTESTKLSTESSRETLDFLKNLNGELRNAYAKKMTYEADCKK